MQTRTRRRPAFQIAAAGAAAACVSLPAAGQVSQPTTDTVPETGAMEERTSLLDRTAVEFRAAAGYTAEADLDEGNVSVGRLDTGISTVTRLGDRSTIAFRLGSEFSFYDFGDAGAFSVDEGIDSAAAYSANIVYAAQIDDRWGWFAGGSIAASPAEGASWGDSITGGGIAGVTYQLNDSLRIGAGVSVATRLEDDVRVIPLPTLDWRIDERWRVRTANRPLQVRGLELSYEATERLTVFALGGWASREYRLDDDGGPAPDGVFRDDSIPLYLGATFRPTDHVEIDAGIGGSVWAQYELLDSTGTEIADSDSDPALGGWIGATIRF